MSSWAVWASIGRYPQAPGSGQLALADPVFPTVVLHRPGSPAVAITRSPSAARTADVRGLITGERPGR